MATSALHSFACPVCGRVRDVSARALREISQGARTGECRSGDGCRSLVSRPERLRRWWLYLCGVTDVQIRKAGGAVPFVLEFGMPDLPRMPARPTVVVLVPPSVPRPAGERARSKLPGFCFDQADGDPELALWLAVEILARGIPAHGLAHVDADAPELVAA